MQFWIAIPKGTLATHTTRAIMYDRGSKATKKHYADVVRVVNTTVSRWAELNVFLSNSKTRLVWNI